MHSPWIFMQSLVAATTRCIPMISSGNMIFGLNIDPSYPISMDPDLALSDSWDWDFTRAPNDRAGHLQQAILTCHLVSSFISLYNAQAAPLLFLSHMTTTYLHFVEALTAGWPCSCQPLW